jgi:hypothetical protein
MDFLASDEFGTVLKIATARSADTNAPAAQESRQGEAAAEPLAAVSNRYIPVDPITVKYGALSANLPGHCETPYYLSTAIAYTNGYPHVGHAYEVC